MSQFISFVQSHEAVLAAAGVAILDLVFAINPNAAANGILHYIYLQLGGK